MWRPKRIIPFNEALDIAIEFRARMEEKAGMMTLLECREAYEKIFGPIPPKMPYCEAGTWVAGIKEPYEDVERERVEVQRLKQLEDHDTQTRVAKERGN